MIKKKYSMFKLDGLTRLWGRGPYAHDMKSVGRQIAFTFRLLELSRSPFVLIVGSYVRKEFVTRYGEFQNGDKRIIGGIERTLFYMRHPEHTYRYATKHQLRELRRTLKKMQELNVPVDISLDWINERIKQSGKHKESVPPPCSTPSPFGTQQAAQTASQQCINTIEKRVKTLTPEQRQRLSVRMEALRADPSSAWHSPQYREAVSKSMKAAWADPTSMLNSAHNRETSSASMKAIWADPNSTFNSSEYREAMSKNAKATWADPNNTFNSSEYREAMSKRMKGAWADPNNTFNSPEFRKAMSTSRKDAWADPNSTYNSTEYREALKEASSIGMKNAWADPDSVYNSKEHREVLSKASREKWADPNSWVHSKESRDMKSKTMSKTRADPNSRLNINQKNSGKLAMKRVDIVATNGKFDRASLHRKRTTFPPLAAHLARPELLFHLRWALSFLDLDVPDNLEKPGHTEQRPGTSKDPNAPKYYTAWLDIQIDFKPHHAKFFAMEKPCLTKDEIKELFPNENESMMYGRVYEWVKLYLFAEDVVQTAQGLTPKVKGLTAVPYQPRTGNWAWAKLAEGENI